MKTRLIYNIFFLCQFPPILHYSKSATLTLPWPCKRGKITKGEINVYKNYHDTLKKVKECHIKSVICMDRAKYTK